MVVDAFKGYTEEPGQYRRTTDEVEWRQYGMNETGTGFAVHESNGQLVKDNGIDTVERRHEQKPVSNLTLSARLGYCAHHDGGRGGDCNGGNNCGGDAGSIKP